MSDEKQPRKPTCHAVDPHLQCPVCGVEHPCVCDCDSDDFEPCGMCGGDGWLDAYEEDPLWYNPGDLVRCSQCGGRG